MNTIHKGYCYGHKNEKGKSLFKHTHECLKHVSAQAYQLHCFVFMDFLVRESLKYIKKSWVIKNVVSIIFRYALYYDLDNLFSF